MILNSIVKINFASSVNAPYPNTKKIILDKFKEIAKDVLGYDGFNAANSKRWNCNFHSHRHCLYSGIYYFDNNQ